SGVEAASSNEVEDQVKQEFSEYSSKQSYPFIRNAMTALDALVSPAIAKILGEMGGKATTMAINYFNNTG
ncbi:MAG: hypothetical protein KGH65_04395, partial [Candidatus Micrarchaeota archaeon]|nr:hypothetical protein [Candidatus Micrarchaeota archaeon]